MMNSSVARPKDIELVQPPSDSVSKIEFSPTQDILAVASWDNNVRLYEVNSQGQSQPKAMYSHEAPVLDLCWSKSGTQLISAGCDNAARCYDTATGQSSQVAAHDGPIKCVRWVDMPNGSGENGVLVTAGWDKKLKYWDMRSSNPIAQVDLPERAYAMDVSGQLLVVGTADRQILIFNLSNPTVVHRSLKSPLKWQTRSIACFPTGEGFAIGSIEGRVAIQYADEKQQSLNFSFKCHRMEVPAGTPGANTGSQHVFSVNDISFHKTHGTFSTAGSDGSLSFWDGNSRTRLKTYSAKEMGNGNPDARPPQWGVPIVSTAFSRTGEIFAYAYSYDWSKGHGGVPPPTANATRVMLHAVVPEEVRQKPKK